MWCCASGNQQRLSLPVGAKCGAAAPTGADVEFVVICRTVPEVAFDDAKHAR